MGEMVTMLVLWLVVIGVMWFLLMRPQKKRTETYPADAGFYGGRRHSSDDKRFLRSHH